MYMKNICIKQFTKPVNLHLKCGLHKHTYNLYYSLLYQAQSQPMRWCSHSHNTYMAQPKRTIITEIFRTLQGSQDTFCSDWRIWEYCQANRNQHTALCLVEMITHLRRRPLETDKFCNNRKLFTFQGEKTTWLLAANLHTSSTYPIFVLQ
jgi:hypothetical protein